MRHEKVSEKVGYHLYVQDRHETESTSSSGFKRKRKLFVRQGGLFNSAGEAQRYGQKHYEGRKIHVEGVRVNIKPLELPRRRDEGETKVGTHR